MTVNMIGDKIVYTSLLGTNNLIKNKIYVIERMFDFKNITYVILVDEPFHYDILMFKPLSDYRNELIDKLL